MQLFNEENPRSDHNWPVKEFFNSIYSQGRFLWALPLIVTKKGCVANEAYCLFPDFVDADPAGHFEGVMFGVFNSEAIISDNECSRYIGEACELYLKLHINDKEKIAEILSGAGDAIPSSRRTDEL